MHSTNGPINLGGGGCIKLPGTNCELFHPRTKIIIQTQHARDSFYIFEPPSETKLYFTSILLDLLSIKRLKSLIYSGHILYVIELL